MNLRKIITTVTLLALLAGAFSLTACSTWRGAGEDVEKTGDAMQGDEDE